MTQSKRESVNYLWSEKDIPALKKHFFCSILIHSLIMIHWNRNVFMASLQILWSLEAAYFLQLKEKQWDCHVVVVKFCFSTLMMYCIISGIFCFFICRIFKNLWILRFLSILPNIVCVPQLRAEVPQTVEAHACRTTPSTWNLSSNRQNYRKSHLL